MSNFRSFAPLVFAVMLGLTACGGEEKPTPAPQTPTAQVTIPEETQAPTPTFQQRVETASNQEAELRMINAQKALLMANDLYNTSEDLKNFREQTQKLRAEWGHLVFRLGVIINDNYTEQQVVAGYFYDGGSGTYKLVYTDYLNKDAAFTYNKTGVGRVESLKTNSPDVQDFISQLDTGRGPERELDGEMKATVFYEFGINPKLFIEGPGILQPDQFGNPIQ